MTETRDDRIRARAYDLWQSDGGKAGDDWAYWLRAEREISEEEAASVGSASTSTPASDGPLAVPAKEPIKKASPKKPPTAKSTAAKPAAAKQEKAPGAAKPAAKGKTKAAPAAPASGKR